MARSEYNIPNQSGSGFRSDLNIALAAIRTNNSGAGVPSNQFDYMQYVEDTVGDPNVDVVYQRGRTTTFYRLYKIGGPHYFRDGTAAAPSLTFDSDVDTGISRPAANTLAFSTAGVEAFRVDSSGQVGIGQPAPDSPLHVKRATQGTIQKWAADLGVNDRTCELLSPESDSLTEPFIFSTNNSWRFRVDTTEALTIDDIGHVGIGLTNPSDYKTNADDLVVGDISDGNGHGITVACGSTNAGRICFADGTDTASEQRGMVVYVHGTNDVMQVHVEGTQVATFDANDLYVMGVTQSGGNTAGGVVKAEGFNTKAGHSGSLQNNNFNVSWSSPNAQLYIDNVNLGTIASSSDYRIKQNISTITTECIDRIKLLRPVQYEFGSYGELFTPDGVIREGFIAHEVASVISSGVEGEKDDPNCIQSLRLDAILSVTVKALQEAVTKIETLETSVASLEARITALETV